MTEVRYMEGSLTGTKYKPGITFPFCLAVPCAEVESYALLVEHDGQNDANVNALLRLAEEGKAPYCVSVGVKPGFLWMPDGTQREMRKDSYDLFNREYGDFLRYELIPYIEKTYRIRFSASPDMHMLSGGSSGGISAFAVAWFHPDYFRRVYMSSPSFLAMGRGNELPYLVRKYETKPLRVYEECSENEPNDYFGWSRAVAEDAREALVFANYDFKYKYFAGESHCSRYGDENEAYERNEWMWRGWREQKIAAAGNSARVDKVIPFGSVWQRCEAFPEKGETAAPELLAGAYGRVVLSNDGQAWYAADGCEDTVYMYVNGGDIQPARHIVHTMLHTVPQQRKKGVIDMAVDRTDRLFVLTEIGVQCVRSYGLVDVVLDLPDGDDPREIAVTDALYVRMGNGIYRRELCEECVAASAEKRKRTSYYD